jgi:hypothetical protein
MKDAVSIFANEAHDMTEEYDFFDTPIVPFTVLQDQAEVEINVRNTATMEQTAVRAVVAKSIDKLPDGEGVPLNCYGRLGAKIEEQWYIHVLQELEEAALATHHETAKKMDMEQSLDSPEQFRKSRYRKD